MKQKNVHLALIQMKMKKDVAKNLEHAEQLIQEAAKKKAKIIGLPELFTTEYFPYSESKTNFKFAETLPGPTTDRLQALAKKYGIVIIAPLFEKRTQGLYHNTAVVIDANGKILGKYRKMHIPDDPHFYEKYYFAPGDLGFKVFDTAYAKIGVLICWDQWYPEAARLATLKGAQILFYPTAIGWHASETAKNRKLQQSAWQTVQNSHAITNGVFVAATNRTGKEKKLSFWGSSFIAAPDGEVLKQASVAKEEILYANCNLSDIERFRQEWPFLRDRRVDAYQNITKRFV